MQLGSSRWGNDFETKVREFVVKYGYEIIAENESIDCLTESHSKKSHEIDVIAEYSSAGYAFPPQYGPSRNEKFLVSAKGGLSISENDINDARNQLQCLKKHNEFKDIKKGVVICEHSTTSYPPIEDDVYVWDEKFMHLLAMKMRVHKVIKTNPNFQQHFFPVEQVSLIFQIATYKSLLTQQEETSMTFYIFNENPTKKLGKQLLMKVLDPFSKNQEAGFLHLNKIINIYSPSGFLTDLLNLKGKNLPEDKRVFFNSFSDLSIATWVPVLENDMFF